MINVNNKEYQAWKKKRKSKRALIVASIATLTCGTGVSIGYAIWANNHDNTLDNETDLSYIFKITDLKGVPNNNDDTLFNKLFELNKVSKKLQNKIKSHCHFDVNTKDVTGVRLVLNQDDKTFKNPLHVTFIVLNVDINTLILNTSLNDSLEDNDLTELFEEIMNSNPNTIKNLTTVQYIQHNSNTSTDPGPDNQHKIAHISMKSNDYGWFNSNDITISYTFKIDINSFMTYGNPYIGNLLHNEHETEALWTKFFIANPQIDADAQTELKAACSIKLTNVYGGVIEANIGDSKYKGSIKFYFLIPIGEYSLDEAIDFHNLKTANTSSIDWDNGNVTKQDIIDGIRLNDPENETQIPLTISWVWSSILGGATFDIDQEHRTCTITNPQGGLFYEDSSVDVNWVNLPYDDKQENDLYVDSSNVDVVIAEARNKLESLSVDLNSKIGWADGVMTMADWFDITSNINNDNAGLLYTLENDDVDITNELYYWDIVLGLCYWLKNTPNSLGESLIGSIDDGQGVARAGICTSFSIHGIGNFNTWSTPISDYDNYPYTWNRGEIYFANMYSSNSEFGRENMFLDKMNEWEQYSATESLNDTKSIQSAIPSGDSIKKISSSIIPLICNASVGTNNGYINLKLISLNAAFPGGYLPGIYDIDFTVLLLRATTNPTNVYTIPTGIFWFYK